MEMAQSSPEHAAGWPPPPPKGPPTALSAPPQPEQPDSALLVKSMEAFRYSVQAYVPPGREVPGESNSMAAGSQAPLGIAGAGLRCSWRGATRTLVLAGKGSHRLFHAVVAGPPTTACPAFLAGLAPDARVHAAALRIFEDILGGPAADTAGSLPATLDRLLAGAAPRSILCTGACVGGLLATLAAAWVALRWPDADVRCIVFGTPRLANAAFNHVFGWLVGLSYRCVYRFDPMPEAPVGAASASPLLGLLGRLRLEFTPTQPDVFLDGRGRARLEDRPILVHYRWSDHDLRAYLATLLELAEEHHWSVSPPVNQMGMCELVDPFVMAQESRLRLAAQHGASCKDEGGQASQSGEQPGESQEQGRGSPGGVSTSCGSGSASLDPSASSACSPPASPSTPAAPAGGGRAVRGQSLQASWSGSVGPPSGAGSGEQHSQPGPPPAVAPSSEAPVAAASRVAAGAARSTQLLSSLALPDPDPGAAPQGVRSAARSQGRSSFGSRLRGLFTCQPPLQPARGEAEASGRAAGSRAARRTVPGAAAPRATPPLLHPTSSSGLPSGDSFSFSAVAASVPATSAHLLQAWQDIREALGQIEQVHRAMYPGPGRYVGEAAADAIAQQFAAGQALAHQATAGSGTGSIAGPPAPTAAAAVGGAGGGQAEAGHAPSTGAGALGKAAGGLQLGWDELEWAASAGQGAAEPGSAAPSRCGALQLLVARRLRLPLRLSLAAYEDEAGFRRSTGIACSALVDDRLFDAQAHVAWLPAGAAGTAVFAFRGTSNRADLLADIKMLRRQVEFLPTQLPGAKCHLGFLQQALALTSATSPACNIGCVLAGLSGGAAPSRIICCGHSLGGAVASIASVWAALQWPHADVRCFSFGAPKCGNRKFVRAMQTLVGMRARVTHNADPIPALPPAWVARYHHMSPTCHLRGSELVLSHGPPTFFPRLSLRDHQLLQYAKALAAVARGGPEQDLPATACSSIGRQRSRAADGETGG